MEHAKRLYLVDEFDRVYKQLQRPSAAVAKTHSSIQLSKTLQDKQLGDDEKVRRYVAELHRYLNISDSQTQQQQRQQTVKRSRKRPLNVNTDRPILTVTRPQPARRPSGYLVPNPTFQRRRRHHHQEQQLPPSHESLYYDAAEQQLDELQSEQHGVTIHDETE